MNEQWRREVRQRQLVRDVLAGYRNGDLALRRLVENLQALSDEMTLVTDAWRQKFQAEVNGLEVTYAVALDRGVADHLPGDFQSDIDESVRLLEAMMETLHAVPADASSAIER